MASMKRFLRHVIRCVSWRRDMPGVGGTCVTILVIFLVSCGGAGVDLPPPGFTTRVPAEGEPAPPAYAEPYVIAPDDELQIVVIAHPEFGAVAPVRPDGTITAPGVGTVMAGGRTPEELAVSIEGRLSRVIRQPQVDIVVTRLRPRGIFIVGEVEEPGERPYRPGVTVLQALAMAGGPLRSGKLSSVLLMRRIGPEEIEVRRVDVEGVLERREGSVDPLVSVNDIVLVPKTAVASWKDFLADYFRPVVDPVALYVQTWWAVSLTSGALRVTFR